MSGCNSAVLRQLDELKMGGPPKRTVPCLAPGEPVRKEKKGTGGRKQRVVQPEKDGRTEKGGKKGVLDYVIPALMRGLENVPQGGGAVNKGWGRGGGTEEVVLGLWPCAMQNDGGWWIGILSGMRAM